MRFILLMIFLLNCSLCFADKKYFYDPETGREVYGDLSLTKEYVKEQFDLKGDLVEMTIKDDEAVKIVNGNFEIYNSENEIKKEKEEKEKRIKKNRKDLREKLNLTDEELNQLIEVIKE